MTHFINLLAVLNCDTALSSIWMKAANVLKQIMFLSDQWNMEISIYKTKHWINNCKGTQDTEKKAPLLKNVIFVWPNPMLFEQQEMMVTQVTVIKESCSIAC